jgi:hypothetical protein
VVFAFLLQLTLASQHPFAALFAGLFPVLIAASAANHFINKGGGQQENQPPGDTCISYASRENIAQYCASRHQKAQFSVCPVSTDDLRLFLKMREHIAVDVN